METAIKNGYRMIDTACAYGNHKEVGAAMKKCIDEGIIKREDMFITTKIWICDWKPENVEKAMQVALEELQTSYMDLLLIHYPPFFNLEPNHLEKDGGARPARTIRELHSRIGTCESAGSVQLFERASSDAVRPCND